MASQGYTQSWVPYDNNKDCSQGFCSLYCPQWCYFIFSPPPPFEFPDDNSNPSFSPLVIVIMGILASAFLFVSYYTLVSKYCGNTDSLRRANQEPGEDFEENHSQMHHEPWQATTMGLDETLIKSIAVCKYKKGDGLVEGTDCSVCLNEFEDDESLRLLPKCSHAFHLPCIDMWLKFHSTCPLCRANIVSTSPLSLQLPPSVPENHLDNRPSPESRFENDTLAVIEDLERGGVEETSVAGDVPKTPLGAPSDSGDLKERDTVVDIREERTQPIRRSVSMDFSCQGHVSIADILGIYRDEDPHMEDLRFPAVVGSSKDHEGEHSKSNSRSRVLHCVMSPTTMKRSFSSGRFLFTKYGRGRNAIIPL